jgi:hypothetical protein
MPDVGQDAGQFANAASSNYGSALRLTQALRAAAQQQQQRADQQRLESFKNELEILKAGGQPDTIDTGGTIASGGLGHRQPNTAADPNGSLVTEPISGKRYRVPVPKKGKDPDFLDDTNSFTLGGGVLDNLNAAGVNNGGQLRIPVKGNEGLLKSLSEAHGEKPMEFHTSGPDGSTHVFERDPKSGKWTNVGNFEDTAKPTAAKKANRRLDTEHFDQPVWIDEDTQEITPAKLPAGVKSQLTPSQQEARTRDQERRDDRAKTEADKAQRDAEKKGEATQKAVLALNTKEQGHHESRKKYGEVLSQIGDIKPGDKGSVIDPDTKKAVPINDTTREARRKYYQGLYQKATDMVDVYQSQQRQLLGQGGQAGQPAGRAPAEPEASTTTAAPTRRSQYNPAPGTRKNPPGPTKGQKTAGLSQVRAYAKKHGITDAQALKKAQSEGYAIQGQ